MLMKYVWLIISIVSLALIVLLLLFGMVEYLSGKILLAVSAALFVSSFLKVIGFFIMKKTD